MTETIFPIRGAQHHPPASLILSFLGNGTELFLQRDPQNPYDSNAIEVWLKYPINALDRTARVLVDESQEADGKPSPDWANPIMLAFVGREYAASIAPLMDEHGLSQWDARLAQTPDGKPAVEVPSFDIAEAEEEAEKFFLGEFPPNETPNDPDGFEEEPIGDEPSETPPIGEPE